MPAFCPISSRGPASRFDLTRRRFLARAASLAAPLTVPFFVPASVLGRGGAIAPSERIAVGSIGLGGRGMNHVDAFLALPETQIVAVCDPYDSKRVAAKKQVEAHYARMAPGGDYKGCASASDFREITGRKDIDAVVIASPENWHALHAAEAVKAGKDVYCEKALSLTVEEGRALCEAVRRHGRVLQVGTQQRSDPNFRFACELARNGYVGTLRTVTVGVPGGRVLPEAPVVPVPPGLDYEMWLGPAPWTPYNDLKCTFNWYFMSDYCAGWIQSWGVHHVDIALWGAPALGKGRLEVEGTAVFPSSGLADTSVTWRVEARSPAGGGPVLRFSDNAFHRQGVRFEGEKGWVHVDRGGIWAEPESLLKVALRPGEERLYESDDHHRDFIRCIRSRRDPAAPVEAGHRATTLTLVSDIATRLVRKLEWDWTSERFVNDDAANRMLRRAMRGAWSV